MEEGSATYYNTITFALRRISSDGMRDPLMLDPDLPWRDSIGDISNYFSYVNGISITDEKKVIYLLQKHDDGFFIILLRRVAGGRFGDSVAIWINVPKSQITNYGLLNAVVSNMGRLIVDPSKNDTDRLSEADGLLRHLEAQGQLHNDNGPLSMPDAIRNDRRAAYLMVDNSMLADWRQIVEKTVAIDRSYKMIVLINSDSRLEPNASPYFVDLDDYERYGSDDFIRERMAAREYDDQRFSNLPDILMRPYLMRVLIIGVVLVALVGLAIWLLGFRNVGVTGNNTIGVSQQESDYSYFTDENFGSGMASALRYLDGHVVWRRSEMERIDSLKGIWDRINNIDVDYFANIPAMGRLVFSNNLIGKVSEPFYHLNYSSADLRGKYSLSKDGEQINIDEIGIRLEELGLLPGISGDGDTD